MEITIGIRDVSRELSLEVGADADEVARDVADVLAKVAGGDAAAVLDLTDERGNRVLIPGAALAYVRLGASEARRVGFVSG